MDRFVTIVPTSEGDAFLLWQETEGAAPDLLGSHRSLDEIEGASDLAHYRFESETSFTRGSLNGGRYPVSDRDGKPLWDGARLNFCIPSHHINTVAGEGAFVAADAYGGCRILSDREITVYGPQGTAEGRRREVYTAVRTFQKEGPIGPVVSLAGALGDPHEHGQVATYISVQDDPRRVCVLEYEPAAGVRP